MTNPTIVKAADTGDFLAVIPALLGHYPTESVVIVPFEGHRTRAAIRIDLPDPDAAAQLASTTAGMVCKLEGATGFALIVYADREQAEPIGAAIAAEASATGLDLVDALYVVDGRWGRVGGDGTLSPIGEVPAHIAAMIDEADHHVGASLPEVDPALAGEIATALPVDLADTAGPELLDLFEQALTWDATGLTAGPAARLITVLDRPALRDVALVQWTHGFEVGALALDAQFAWQDGAEYPVQLAAILWGEGPRPQVARLTAALNVCRHLAALAPGQSQPGPLAAAGWLAWALGRSTHADAYTRRVLELSPGHGLAEIVSAYVHASHLPAWAFLR